MAKRFGRNQKRKLLQQTQAEVAKWVKHAEYAQHRLQAVVAGQQGLHDVGLRVQIRNHFESMGLEVHATLMQQSRMHVIQRHEIASSRDRVEFIKYIAECIARDIVKHLGERITYG